MTLRLSITNLSEPDSRFLRGVIAIFTDPKFRTHAAGLRGRERVLIYAARGAARVSESLGSTSDSTTPHYHD